MTVCVSDKNDTKEARNPNNKLTNKTFMAMLSVATLSQSVYYQSIASKNIKAHFKHVQKRIRKNKKSRVHFLQTALISKFVPCPTTTIPPKFKNQN